MHTYIYNRRQFLKTKIENEQQIFAELQTFAQNAAKGNAKFINTYKCRQIL